MHIINNAPGATAHGYRTAVAIILEHPGTKVSKQYQQILAGLDHAQDAAAATRDSAAFAAAVISGDQQQIEAAMREWQLQRNNASALIAEADQTVARALRDAYATTAVHNYEAIAATFNEKAEALTDGARTVDLSVPADEILLAPDEQRRAWSDAAILSTELDRLVELLDLAARLAKLGHDTGERTAHLAALTIDRDALNDLTTWEVLEQSDHRAGRWSHLISNGIDVRAHAPADTKPVTRPRIEVSYEPGNLGHRRVETVVATNH